MALLLSSWLSELILVLAGAVVVLYLWYLHRFTYWKRRGVPQVEPSFPFGNMADSFLGRLNMGLIAKNLHDKLKGQRFGGIYGFARPMFLVRDPDLIRNILVKDFATFVDRGLFANEERPLELHLANLSGQKWKRLRAKLTPTFTSGKLKAMFSTMDACGRELAEVLADKADSGEILEMRDIAARYTTDIIASVGFGFECHSQRDPNVEFRRWGHKLLTPTVRSGLVVLLSFFNPPLAERLRLDDGNSDAHDYFMNMIRQTVEYREKNNVSRKDFMDLLIQLKNKGFVDNSKNSEVDNWKMSLEEIAAQAFVFYIGGFETSSTTMSFALHSLSQYPEIQKKLQEEIDSVIQQHGGNVTYDAINEMTYLGKVVSETLRKYPPATLLNRVCSEQYKIPDSDVVLQKDTPVVISVVGMHMDPDHFPDPERFDPERFSEEQKAARHPYAYLPFGEGPRICIGMRLGLLQTKIGLVHLLSKFSVLPTEKTKATLDFNSRSLILMSKDGINVRLQKRT